jgi:hypothetical protein
MRPYSTGISIKSVKNGYFSTERQFVFHEERAEMILSLLQYLVPVRHGDNILCYETGLVGVGKGPYLKRIQIRIRIQFENTKST